MQQPTDYPKPIIVFVYGSLKRDLYNHPLLDGSYFIADATTVEKYGMKDLGSFPGVDKDANISTIKGELYEVNEEVLASLDQLEGHPNFYKREMITVNVGEATFPAWCYFLLTPSDYSNQYILDGTWVQESYDRSEYVESPYDLIQEGA